MKTQSSDRTGILMVRLWIEPNAREGLRARITQTLDSTGQEHAMVTAANPEDICTVVRTWVEAFVDQDLNRLQHVDVAPEVHAAPGANGKVTPA